jgi:hypothetical protein
MDKMIETIMKAADALDALGKRDLANELDNMLKRAARQPKPCHKVGDEIVLEPSTKFPVKKVQIHPHFGPSYLLQLWVLEKDLPKNSEPENDDGRDIGPTPRLPADAGIIQ